MSEKRMKEFRRMAKQSSANPEEQKQFYKFLKKTWGKKG